MAKNKLNQRRYRCPNCKKLMTICEQTTVNDKYNAVYCENMDCDYEGVAWDITKLEKYDINKEQRVWDLIEEDDDE